VPGVSHSAVRRLGAVLTFALLVLLPAPTASYAASGDEVSAKLRAAVKMLTVAPETRRGYDRAKFRHWTDADGDCQDTRDEVLRAESLVATSGCDITEGKWRSYYDGETTEDPSEFDIDHLVPLAEAWDSGAKRWTKKTRERFANDLGDRRSLVAVTASANRSKSDRDPSEWMPDRAQCKYVRQWVAVKLRWRLTVNRPERTFLVDRAASCDNVVIAVHRAKIRTAS
jgi:Protein of unknown function (DUF1524)